MTTVAESARITRRGEEETISEAPRRPAADYPAAARFLWEYLRREGTRGAARETHKGRPGWLWEGTVSAAVRFLWPGIGDVNTENAIRAIGRMLRENGSLVVLQAGRGQTLSVVWVSEEYAPGRPERTRRTRPAPAPRPAPVDEQPAAAVDVDELATAAPVDEQPAAAVDVDELATAAPVDEQPPAAAPEAPQDVDEAPAAPEVPDTPPAAAEAPQDVDEPQPAAAAAAGDELATILAGRERDLVALMQRLDAREVELVDRELELVDRQLAILAREESHLERERTALIARRRRLAGAPDSMS